jgi:hypothetical protein
MHNISDTQNIQEPRGKGLQLDIITQQIPAINQNIAIQNREG